MHCPHAGRKTVSCQQQSKIRILGPLFLCDRRDIVNSWLIDVGRSHIAGIESLDPQEADVYASISNAQCVRYKGSYEDILHVRGIPDFIEWVKQVFGVSLHEGVTCMVFYIVSFLEVSHALTRRGFENVWFFHLLWAFFAKGTPPDGGDESCRLVASPCKTADARSGVRNSDSLIHVCR